MGKILIALVISSTMVAMASAAVFNPTSVNLDGYSEDGFTFKGIWYAVHSDARNAPFMEDYSKAHSITFNSGTFLFQSMKLGGFPYDNLGNVTGDGLLNFEFKDSDGITIYSDHITLQRDNTWYTYTHDVAGVHEICFSATGGYINGQWKEGFWPRLDSINAVPEPSTYLAGLSALGMLGLFGWRNRK